MLRYTFKKTRCIQFHVFSGPAIIFHRLCVAGESKIRPEVPSDDEDEEGEEEEEEKEKKSTENGQESEATPTASETPDTSLARKTVKKIVGLVSNIMFYSKMMKVKDSS